jgi:hypothetical protein
VDGVVRSGKASDMAAFRDPAGASLAAICASAVLASAGWLLHSGDSGVVGTNGVRPLAFVGTIPAGHEICDLLGTAKRRPSSALMTLGTAGAGPQPLRISVPGKTPASLVSRYADGVVSLPLPRGAFPNTSQLLCIKNRGRKAVQLGGENFSRATLDRRISSFAVSITLIGRRRSWGAQAGSLLARIGSARGAGGSTTGWAVVILFGATVLVALGAAWRIAR